MNITEFAKAAGVSKSAVSRYFNDGYVSEEKRRLIEAAIEATGYAPSAWRPSPPFRALQTAK